MTVHLQPVPEKWEWAADDVRVDRLDDREGELMLAAVLGLVIGVVIGGLGGGGGVLTVPALVYLLGQSAQDATTGSVIIVGTAAVVGVLMRIRCRGIRWRTAIGFGAVGVPAAYLGTQLNHRVEQPVLLLAFSALTLVAAVAMLLNRDGDEVDAATDRVAARRGTGGTGTAVLTLPDVRRSSAPVTVLKIAICGVVAGFLTGFLGVGGGFLVVPALVVVLRMPMGSAIGTSLLIIVLNALSSVASRIEVMHLDWSVIVPFTVVAVVGTLIGKRVADRFSGATLTRAFAVMLTLVGIAVGAQSLLAL
jgi:uncharacterized protein